MFLPNQKVVCVDGKFPLGIEQLYLCEINGPLNAHGIERGFKGERFAPLSTTEDEVAIDEEVSVGVPAMAPA
jgi:hypothetical protein